jgi:hypothetical protein
VDRALRAGVRGLLGGRSLARLLAAHRGARNHTALPRLTAAAILRWADEHRGRTGSWPTKASGTIPGSGEETWNGVRTALHVGRRGLPGGDSLGRLLARERGAYNPKALPPLTVGRVLRWARAHLRRTGAWPDRLAGPVPEAPGQTWCGIDWALTQGRRGLPGGSSLAKLRREHLGDEP